MKRLTQPWLPELSTPATATANPNPNPNPNPRSQKRRGNHPRKQKCSEQENTDPNNSFDSGTGKPSPAAEMRNLLPPKPPNPLKRKLVNDAVSDIVGCGPSSSSSSDSGVRVVVRMRPLNKDEDGEMIVKKISDGSLSSKGQTFSFDSVADTTSTQEDIFQLVGAPLVENCLSGFNSSVFAYGQTGSGKTYTMWGPANALSESLTNDQQGLTPRVFERLFARLNEEQTKHAARQLKYQCRCSFLEIYNEQITDLLNPSQKNLQIREDGKSGVYVQNLTEQYVSTLRDVIHILLKGLSNRRTGATSMNTESSRSHSVFTCVVESQCKSLTDGLTNFKTSRINLVDLAGSERQKLTGAAGERLKEAGNINRSLSQLGNLINILAEISQSGKERHIPYRDSRLTFLLQESLGGNAKMAMICAISPAQSCKSETFSTLRFAQRAKSIKNKAVVNEVKQDDKNSLKEQIRQLKEEILRMKANGNHTDPSAAYTNSWNARRSLNLLKFSLNHPTLLHHVADDEDDDDEDMEIDEEAVDRLGTKVDFQSSGAIANQLADGILIGQSGSQLLDSKEDSMPNEKQADEISYVIMEDDISEMEGKLVTKSPCKHIEDTSVLLLPDLSNNPDKEAENYHPSGSLEFEARSLSVVPPDVSPTLQPPTQSVSPEIVSSSRKSLKTSSMLSASWKDKRPSRKVDEDVGIASLAKSLRSSQLPFSAFTTDNSCKTSDHLAASLHRGLAILDCHKQSSTFRRSVLSFSLKATESKPVLSIQKVDVGIQASPEEDDENYLCSSCKKRSLYGETKEADDINASDFKVVATDWSLSFGKPKKQIPKAVEKVLAGAIRREMSLEDFCAKQTSEIEQLNRLVHQYKHERECNAIITQLREDKILRLENLMDGVLPSENFMEEELVSLHKEHELLNEKYENHPELLRTKIELMRAQDELERLRNFFDMGERDVLLEEIHDLRCQLQYYTDSSPKTSSKQHKSLQQLTYSKPSLFPLFDTIPETTDENAMEKLQHERNQWVEVENQWTCLAEELKRDLEASTSQTEALRLELEVEKKCSEELKEAMRLAMEGHARMLEQYADLEERHMQMLARKRRMQEGIVDVKKAAAKAGVKGAESKFINALAAQISALKVEREKERQYWSYEKKTLQTQLRDTAEAVQAAGELLVRLKEAEEAVAFAQKRVLMAEEKTEKSYKQIETLKKKHEMEISTLNKTIAESRLPKEALQDPYHEPIVAKYDVVASHSAADDSWKEEFQAFYDNDDELSLKFTEPSSWFSGYDKCNI